MQSNISWIDIKRNLQQLVNTANAERDAKKAKADGEAYAIITRSSAVARAIKQEALALKNNPLYLDYQKIQRWNGAFPQTFLGDASKTLINLK